jgi:DNA uptake protein ComE-like DNA-binding protein
MSWRDFLYFSRSERLGLIILLCLISIAAILLIINNKKSVVVQSEEVVRTQIMAVDTAKQSPDTIKTTPKPVRERSFSSEKPSVETATKPEKKETVSERVERMTSLNRPRFERQEKYEVGTVIELNSADTTTLKKIPGIGSSFAKRIVGYRNLLGGYYSIIQLSEVYGIDEEKYNSLSPWFTVDPSLIKKLDVNTCPQDSLNRHPYISYSQARIIVQLRNRRGRLTDWKDLSLLEEFADFDRIRLTPYLLFEEKNTP